MEFFYRIPGIHEGIRPGAHRSRSPGAGQEFTGHLRLFDAPDVRQLDLKASLQDLRGEWLVRAPRQRSALRVHTLVDVSPSMAFRGAAGSKLDLCADIVAGIGTSASRLGDLASLEGFDHGRRPDVHVPPSAARGVGLLMAALLRDLSSGARPGRNPQAPSGAHDRGGQAQGGAEGRTKGLAKRLARGPATGSATRLTTGLTESLALAHDADLLFLLSDFHVALEAIGPALAAIEHALIVPVVVWSRLETEPPAQSGLVSLADLETGELRPLWIDDALRRDWLDAVAARRSAIDAVFRGRGAAPLHVIDHFDPERFSRYFMEEIA